MQPGSLIIVNRTDMRVKISLFLIQYEKAKKQIALVFNPW